MNVLLRTRGRDPVLNEKEQLVYEATLRKRRLPGGVVRLLPENCADVPVENEKKQPFRLSWHDVGKVSHILCLLIMNRGWSYFSKRIHAITSLAW